uniref:Ig-like domain-containing protein n=1 Tax=Iconisemion striatum TaxID=60296 RepID=A0A1A7WM30_9TELE
MKGTQAVALNANGSLLIIQSVSAADYGWYRCNYSVGQSQRCFMINLQVQEAVFAPTVVSDPKVASTQSARSVVLTGEKQEGGGALVPVVSVVSVVVVLAALTGLFVYNKQRVRQHLGHIAGYLNDSEEFYENVTLPNSTTPTDRINSLYQFHEESVSTFKI